MQIFLFILCSLFITVNAAEDSLPPIFVVGDSHAGEFARIPNCRVHQIGSCTMHRIGRDGLSFLNLQNLGVKEGQAVVFAFGEIDVRCHIGKQRDRFNRTVYEIIDTLVHHYIKTILLNRELYHNLSCIVYSVTPPTDYVYNPNVPRYGPLEERISIAKQLNAKLADVCSQKGIAFLDVYDDYANEDGSLIVDLSDHNVHINPECNEFIHQKLRQILMN